MKFIALFIIVAVVASVWEVLFYPWGTCRRCKGEGRFMSPWTGHWRLCPRCKGSRSRLRPGRRVYNYGRRKWRSR